MPGRIEFEVSLGKGARRRAERDDTPLRVLVISDLRGAAREDEPLTLTQAHAQRIDVDGFDEVLRALKPEVSIAEEANAPALQLSFHAMDHFHPDYLFDALPSIAALRSSRARLNDPRTFAAEKAKLLAESGIPPAPPEAEAGEDDASMLGRLLGAPAQKSGLRAKPIPSADPIDQMLRTLVAPYITAAPGPEQPALIASVDAAISTELQRVLHAPAFQRMEAAWRGLHWLLRDNPLGEALEVYVLDASRAQLIADVRGAGGDLERSALHRIVLRELGDASEPPLSLVIGDFEFDASEDDVPLLAALGALSGQAGGVFLGAGSPRLFGCADLAAAPHRGSWSAPDPKTAERWQLLRASSVAPFIGLSLPRILGRLPYGKRGDPIERFAFTELPQDPPHEAFLWINPAFACAQVIAHVFAEQGRDTKLSGEYKLTDLPMALIRTDGEDALKPCAEVCLDEASADQIAAAGLMPFVSYKKQNAVRLVRVQSIAAPGAPLAGLG